MLKSFRKADDKGFTLVELLIVIAIIGILAAIAIPIFLSQTASADQAAAESEASAVYSMMLNGAALGVSPAALTTTGATTYSVAGVGNITITDGTLSANFDDSTNYCASVTVNGTTAAYGTGTPFAGATTTCN